MPTILEFGTEEQKQRYIPAVLRGEELWVQFMSEPTGGSDLAGALSRATRDGDGYLLNGSKIWSSYAWKSDYALCVCRTDWDVPKHRGLSMLIVKVHQPGIQVRQIKQVDGTEEFCQEFFDDVRIPADQMVGQVNDGWTVASRLLFHERAAVSGASPYEVGQRISERRGGRGGLTALADGSRAAATILGSASCWARPECSTGCTGPWCAGSGPRSRPGGCRQLPARFRACPTA